MVEKLNLDIANIYKSDKFHYTDSNNISISFLHKMAYIFYIQVKNY